MTQHGAQVLLRLLLCALAETCSLLFLQASTYEYVTRRAASLSLYIGTEIQIGPQSISIRSSAIQIVDFYLYPYNDNKYID
ncbi:hypothetical protein IQ07DRAFT_586148, partial [Pyrenochaeta sp. DS3sAY3a]